MARSFKRDSKRTKNDAKDAFARFLFTKCTSRIENNEELPNVLVMMQICQRLGVTIDHVMNLSPKTTRTNDKLFELLDSCFQKRDYRKLEQVLKSSDISENLYPSN